MYQWKRKADVKCWNKSPAENLVFKKSSRMEGLLSNHLQMKCLRDARAQFSTEGWTLKFLQGDIWSEQNQVKCIKNLIRPSLEWLSQHHWTDPAAHPHLFPAQAPHPPAKYRTTDERDVNGDFCEEKSKWIIHKPQNGGQVLNYVD